MDETPGTLELSSVLIVEPTSGDEDWCVVYAEAVVEPLIVEPPVLGRLPPDPDSPAPVWVGPDTTGPMVVDDVVGIVVIVPPQS